MPPVVQVVAHNTIDDVQVVDLRSDTVSKPTPEMRNAMAFAEVGDDVMGEDPTVQKLEARAAELVGKESAVFVPSGTMANLIAIMVHCNQRGSEFICGHTSHIFLYEQGGSAALAGAQCALVMNRPDGTFCLDEVRERIRVEPDVHEPFTSVIAIENTHNTCGGQVLPLTWLDDLADLAQKYNIPIHMDGARLMNAVVHSKIPAYRIARDMTSVCFCLSKGLGCPIGSLLCGSHEFTVKARRVRKMLGGGLRQSGIIAAAGLVALDHMIDRLEVDHKHMYMIAKAIDDLGTNFIRVDLNMVQTNMAMVRLDQSRITANTFLKRLATVKETDPVKVIVKGSYRNDGCFRLVLQWEITEEHVNNAIQKIILVAQELSNNLKIIT